MSRRARERLRAERAAAAARSAARERGWVVFRRAVLAAVGFVSFGVASVAVLASMSPAWWTSVQDVEDARAMAQRFEAGLSRLAAGDGGEDWTVAIDAAAANAWLADRLPRWLANQGVDAEDVFESARVWIDRGVVRIGVERADEAGWPTHVGAWCELDATDGDVRTRVGGLTVGRMGAPKSIVRDALARVLLGLDEGPRALAEDALAGEWIAWDVRDAGVEITGVRIEEARVVVTGRSTRR